MYHNIRELSQHTFYQVDKNLIAALDDFLLAGVLSSLINDTTNPAIIEYSKNNDGFFFITIEKMREELRINYAQQKRCLDQLEDLGLISTGNFGLPCRRHVRIESDAIITFLNGYLAEQNLKKAPVVNDKKQFYDNLNSSIEQGEEAFAENIDNMEPQFAAPLYVFTRALLHFHNIKFVWDGAAYGKFKNIIGYKKTDYQRLIDILADPSFKETNNPINQFRLLNRGTLEYSPDKRVNKASQLSLWPVLGNPITN